MRIAINAQLHAAWVPGSPVSGVGCKATARGADVQQWLQGTTKLYLRNHHNCRQIAVFLCFTLPSCCTASIPCLDVIPFLGAHPITLHLARSTRSTVWPLTPCLPSFSSPLKSTSLSLCPVLCPVLPAKPACAPSTPSSAAHALLGGAEAVHRGQLHPSCHQRTRPHTPHQHGGLLPGAGGRGEAGGE